jgi:hypothetical protein
MSPWVRLDDRFDDDPRVATVGPAGAGLLAMLLAYSNRNLSDGFVSESTAQQRASMLGRRGADALIAEMIDVGLLQRHDRGGLRGFQIHEDFVGLQPTREQVEGERNAAKARKERWRERHSNAAGTVPERRSEQRLNGSGSRLPDPDPDPDPKVREQDTREQQRAATATRFQRFWLAYPHKVSKPAAARAWERLKADDALTDAIVAAVQRDARSSQWLTNRGQFIPHPATWLNGRRWEDRPVSSTPRLEAVERSLWDDVTDIVARSFEDHRERIRFEGATVVKDGPEQIVIATGFANALEKHYGDRIRAAAATLRPGARIEIVTADRQAAA